MSSYSQKEYHIIYTTMEIETYPYAAPFRHSYK